MKHEPGSNLARAGRDIASDARLIGLCILLAATFGLVHDLIDVRISPAFYRLVKHVPASIPVWLGAVLVGVTSGAIMGMLAGTGFCIAADAGKRSPLNLRKVYRRLWIPLTTAGIGSAAGSLLGSIVTQSAGADPGFWTVYGMHSGAYVGATIGTLLAITSIYGSRRPR